MKHSRFAVFAAFVATLLASGFGCELVATVDRSKITGTGGGGGQATSTTSSGMGGMTSTSSTGGGQPCTAPTDCPDPGNECVDPTCDAGTCGTKPKDEGTPTSAQTAGDCQKKQCDGAGAIVAVNDAADLPNDGNDCTDDVCTSGAPSNPSKAVDTACGANGGLKCDGEGKCVGCVTANDCAAQDTDCQVRTCTAGVCGVMNTAQGTPTTAQQAGDCKVDQCDGNGAVETADDNSDVPVDGKACTKDLCSGGVASNPPEASGTVCVEGTGSQCDGAGKCVECLVANDCPGQDTECQQRACNAGVCGTSFTALGTALASQTANDCKKVVCDGSGGTTTQSDDLDLPNDNNPCTNDVCTSGAPSHPNTIDGTSCGANLTCLGGVCNGCAAPSDCPGTDDECKTRTCTAAVCGFSFTASGTAVALQTAGDCLSNQCDGAGNTVSAASNADLPADDGNQCTSEVCNAGVPSHPAKATNTACTQNGGSFCSSGGQCVQCNAPAQCPGSDTDCQARTCSSNACGTAFQPPGTVTSTQTPGDCQVNQCDGAGNIIPVNANGDVPADDGNQCTSEVCNAGAPAHPAIAVDTPCTQNGGSFCSLGGQCVQCNAATQCPGSDTDCQTRICAANACGLSFAPGGTPTSSQTPGDCNENQCDGSGGVVVASKNTDAPADDGNDCTSEICTAGVPSHPNAPAGTMCNQNGGAVCSGAGACVPASCADSIKNNSETDTDCGGGTCPACVNGLICGADSDCQSGVCTGGLCAAPSCTDLAKNGAETDVDCGGGTCDACGTGQICGGNGDCQSGICAGGLCVAPGQGCAQAIVVNPASLPTTINGDTTTGSGHYGFAAGACPGVAGAAGAASNDIAYSFTPTTTGSYVFTLTGSGFDSALYVVTDCANTNGSCVGAVDTSCSGCAESLTTTLTAGTTYFIVVDGSSNATNLAGPYSLAIKPAKSFNNPLQIDVSALLIDDTVVNNGLGAIDTVQDAIDGQANDIPTQGVAKALGGATGVGLPDNAIFAADANHPLLHLGWDNANNGPNSRVVKSGFNFTMPVPVDTYAQLQIYALSTEGNSSMQFILNYSDATTDTRSITFGDWYNDPAPAGQFFLINGLDRIGPSPLQTFQSVKDPAMAGVSLNPNPAKTLVSVQVNHLASNGWFIFYGAAGW